MDESRLKGGEGRLRTHRLMEMVSQVEDPDVLQGETCARSVTCDRRDLTQQLFPQGPAKYRCGEWLTD